MENLLDKSLSEPLDKSENILNTKLTKRKIRENVRKKLDPDVLKFQTGGKPLTFVRTVVSQKNPMSFGKQWQRNRIKMLNKCREQFDCKIETELSLTTKTRREHILKNTLGGKVVRLDCKKI